MGMTARIASLSLLAFGLALPPAHADLTYADFASTSGLTLLGAAGTNATVLRLTPQLNSQAGGAWANVKQDVSGSFRTEFEFKLGGGADGFAFLIQNDSIAALSGSGCELGYHGMNNSLAVEFDTWENTACAFGTVADPNAHHISVHSGGFGQISASEIGALAVTPFIGNFSDGQVYTVRIDYVPGTLHVYLDDFSAPVLSASVDLGSLLNLDAGHAWVGFTAATGGFAQPHDIHSWSFVENPFVPSGNQAPLPPLINEPATNGQTVNPADVHMEALFSDNDAGDSHFCSDWEIWQTTPLERVWSAHCIIGLEQIHIHLGDGAYEGSHAGLMALLNSTDYTLRTRHRDDSGDPLTEWGPWSYRDFLTGAVTTFFPLLLDDILSAPAPVWRSTSGNAYVLPAGGPPPTVRLESPAGDLMYEFMGFDGVTNIETDAPELPEHEAVRVVVDAGGQALVMPATDLTVTEHDCDSETLLLPAVNLSAGQTAEFWVTSDGATYVASPGQLVPDFSVVARSQDLPWVARQPGYEIDVVAGDFQLPVNIAFVPSPGPAPGDPLFYVTELYGTIKVVTNDYTVGIYVDNLLNFAPSGNFPGSGEQGVTGLAVDPVTGDVFASMLYASTFNPSNHYPKVVRFTSVDGGHTSATQTTILDMSGESQGQSHQISTLTIHPDGRLFCHNGDGFNSGTAQNLNSYRGKILRMELDGSAPTSNPFYDASNGINSRDYSYGYGVRNPFGGTRRALDGMQYIVENGPSVDRLTRLVSGRNYLWNGSDASMMNFAIHTWAPATGPVNIAFIQPETFGGSGFPADKMDHAFVTESGSTYAIGPQFERKRISEYIIDANGVLVAAEIPFVDYIGVGRSTVAALAAGPDGLYFSDLYADDGTQPHDVGAKIMRVRWHEPLVDCNGNGAADSCDIASGNSPDGDSNGVPDECQCTGANFCTSDPNSTGQAALMSASGCNSVATDNLVLEAGPVPVGENGLFYYGPNELGLTFGNGTRCVGGPPGQIFRLFPILTSTPGGTFTRGLNISGLPTGGEIDPGTTWKFQAWFRDPSGGGAGFDLSDGLSVTFAP
jgi:glucose/arabinose dehydrogenase